MFINNHPGWFYCRLFHFYCLCRAGLQQHKPLLSSKVALHWNESSASYTWCSSVHKICTFFCSGAGHNISTASKAVIHVLQQPLSPKAPPRLFIWEGAVFLGTALLGIGSNCAATSLGQFLSSCSVSLLGLFTFTNNEKERDNKVEQKQSLPYL